MPSPRRTCPRNEGTRATVYLHVVRQRALPKPRQHALRMQAPAFPRIPAPGWQRLPMVQSNRANIGWADLALPSRTLVEGEAGGVRSRRQLQE